MTMALHAYLITNAFKYSYCYKLVQRFMVTCLFTGQYITKAYGTFTDVIYSEWLDQDAGW